MDFYGGDMEQKMTENNYVVYHLHTEQSLLDSCTNYKDYVDRAVKLGQKAIAFTEHGNVFTWVEKKIAPPASQTSRIISFSR